jgi:hypothetical protein
MRRLRELKRSLKNLWRWFPIIWKDRDWDHSYIYTILEFKLRNQSDYISKADRHTMSQKDAKDMLICAELINKVNNDFYNTEYIDYEESEFKFLDIPDKPDFKKLEINMVVDNLDIYFNKYPTWHKRAINYIKENEYRFESDHNDRKLVAMVMGDLRQEKAKELVFKIMSDKINGWWD